MSFEYFLKLDGICSRLEDKYRLRSDNSAKDIFILIDYYRKTKEDKILQLKTVYRPFIEFRKIKKSKIFGLFPKEKAVIERKFFGYFATHQQALDAVLNYLKTELLIMGLPYKIVQELSYRGYCEALNCEYLIDEIDINYENSK